MRIRSAVPAIQLGSASTRYQGAWNLYSRGGRRSILLSHSSSEEAAPNVDAIYNDCTPGTRTNRLARLEAILFLSRESLNSRKLSEYADLDDGTEARTLICQLNELYQEEQSVLRVERVAGGYQLVTHWQFGRWLKRLGADQPRMRLSAPSMETLAVVAYRQPVLRAEVEAIRGVNCGEMLRQLMDRDLIRIRGRSEELGRPYLYGTTKTFLQLFGLDTIEEMLEMDVFADQPESPEDTTMMTEDVDDGTDGNDQESEDELDSKEEWVDELDADEQEDESLEEEEEEEWEDEWEEVDGGDEEEEDVDESWQDEDDWEDEDAAADNNNNNNNNDEEGE